MATLIVWSTPTADVTERRAPVPGESDAWALLEARNRDGSLALPPSILRSNENLRFHTRDPDQPEQVRVEIGYEPNPILFVNLKAYPVQRIVQSGTNGRRKAKVWVEFPMSRGYEKEWFEYMNGLPLIIRRVTPDAVFEPPVELHVTDVLFTRKWALIGVDANPNPKPVESLQAVVTAEESNFQWITRHWHRLIEYFGVKLLLPVVSAIIVGIAVRWFYIQPLTRRKKQIAEQLDGAQLPAGSGSGEYKMMRCFIAWEPFSPPSRRDT